jgi:hypothetical protein
MIETNPFILKPKTYFKILLKTRLQKQGWIYGLLTVVGLLHLYWYFTNNTYGNLVWAVLCFTIPLFVIVYLYRFSVSDINKDFLSEKQLFFDTSNFKLVDKLGNEGVFTFKDIQFVKETPEYWLLYLGKTQFFYIPKNIFKTNQDKQKFQELITK